MGKIVAYTGNQAIAEGMRQINPDVCAAYPITPQTELMQQFASFVADGLVDTELVTVESEHSAMSACVGAAAAGGRVMTATSAQGMALMWEIMYCASGLRLPIVMTIVNRALNAPLNIHGDHSDAMGARDSGWIQIFSENAQEAYDNLMQAVRIGEEASVRLPVAVCYDGFIISHSIERMEILEDEEVKGFVGPYQNLYHPMLDIAHPVTYGPVDLQDYYTEHKRQQVEAMKNALPVILGVAEEYKKLTGRGFGYFETYRLDDAEIGMFIMGSAAGTAKEVVDELRATGIKAGLLKLRIFRPFPYQEVTAALKNLKVLAIMDRAESFGAMGGPTFNEIRSALLSLKKPPLTFNYVYGLGGREPSLAEIHRAFARGQKVLTAGKAEVLHDYLQVRE
jgi:pyruvate ferredoxin oxidoreductase alpha subunit